QMQDLHIEGPSVDPGQAEQRPGGGTLEELEPALGVGDLELGHPADDPVAELAQRLADPVLVSRDERRVGPGADGADRPRTHRPEPFQLLDGGGEVGVADENPVADGGPYTLAHGVTLAAVTRITHEPDARIGRRGPQDRLRGPVDGAVVDDDELPR